jgi:hypothetical protein
VVAGSLTAAWRATRKRRNRSAKAAKPTEEARKAGARAERRVAEPQRDPRPWRIYLNEAEIERREAIKRAAARPPADEASAGSKR